MALPRTDVELGVGKERDHTFGVGERNDVVGVAVRIMPGTGINFAVPGDAVHHLFDGRIARMQLGQPFHKDGTTRLTVSMEMIDPLKHVRKPVLDVWTGKRSPDERPATMSVPADAPGDSPHKHYEMAYQDSVATAEVTLPALPPGMGYWIRPGWTAADKLEWATARVCEFSEPVELRTARLAAFVTGPQSGACDDQSGGLFAGVDRARFLTLVYPIVYRLCSPGLPIRTGARLDCALRLRIRRLQLGGCRPAGILRKDQIVL